MIEGRALSSGTDCCLEGRLCSCEVRMLNPRKIFTRVNVELALTPYVPASLSVCSGVKEQEAYKIETLCEKKAITVIRADGSTEDIIRDGRFVVPGSEALNQPLDEM